MKKPPITTQDNARLRAELERFAEEQGLELREPEQSPAEPFADREAAEPVEAELLDARGALYPGGVVPAWVQAAHDREDGRALRKPGRPKKGHGIRWKEIEHVFVFGEPYKGDDGNTYVRFPSCGELARRFRVRESSLRSRAKKEQWAERRARVESRTEELVEDALISQRAERQIDARKEATEACDILLAQFNAAVKEGRIEVSSALDFERIARLALRLGGEADRTHDHQHTLTLEQLQERRVDSRRRHRRLPDAFGIAGREGIPEPVILPLAVEPSSK